MSIKDRGVILTGIADMAQSLDLYFRTPKGSICLHPELGFGIFDYVDRNPGAVLQLIREVRKGISLWDSRILVIAAEPIFEVGKLKMKVRWSPKDTTNNVVTTFFQL